MLMPGRSGSLKDGAWIEGGNGVLAQLSIDDRSGNQPSEYVASESIEFLPGFESGVGDAFVAYIDPEAVGNGSEGSGLYRYGFNGQEKSDEIKGNGNSYTAEFWEYDPRIGRRWNLDPKPIVGLSEYSTFGNNPILYGDPFGDTLSNPQLIGAMKIASNEIMDAIKNKRGFFANGTNSRLLGSANDYIKNNDLNLGDASDFIGQVEAYHTGLASVAKLSSQDFIKLDRSVINNSKISDFQKINITIGTIYESDADLRQILNIGANVAMGEAAGGAGISTGRALKSINFGSQSGPIGNVPKNIHPGQQGKHIIGHNNYIPGRSILTENPQNLLNQYHSNNTTFLRQPNAEKIIVDFHKPIGIYVDDVNKISRITSRGIIVRSNKGAHIIPSSPQ